MYPAPRTVRIACGSPGFASTLRRRRAMRMSIERSNGSQSRLRVRVRIWSRVSTLLGCSVNTLSRSNSMLVIGTSCAVDVEQAVRGDVEEAAADRDALGAAGGRRSLRRGRARCRRRMTLFRRASSSRGIERLRDVVVGADLEADDAVDDAVRGRHHDDAHVVALAQVARQREPVLAREPDVEQHDVRQVALDRLAHVAAAFAPGAPRSPARRGTRRPSRACRGSSSTISTLPLLAIEPASECGTNGIVRGLPPREEFRDGNARIIPATGGVRDRVTPLKQTVSRRDIVSIHPPPRLPSLRRCLHQAHCNSANQPRGDSSCRT